MDLSNVLFSITGSCSCDVPAVAPARSRSRVPRQPVWLRCTRSSDTVGPDFAVPSAAAAASCCSLCVITAVRWQPVTQAGAEAVPLQYRAGGDRPLAQDLQQLLACVVSQFSEPLGVCTPASFLVTALRVRWPENADVIKTALARVLWPFYACSA
jgi:hypothetical protein